MTRESFGHREVFLYINDYATTFGLTKLVRFGTEVVYVGLVNGKWRTKSKVANGIDAWREVNAQPQLSYSDPFRDLVVILRGVGSSVLDISMNIAQVAKEVHIASRSAKVGVLGNMFGYDNLRLHPMHTFPPALAPWLPFVGFTIDGYWLHIVLISKQMNSKGSIWSIGLPSEEEMMRDVEA
ncbi:hypothetical protein AAG906_002779 [Vitis piasezkii]